MSRYCTKALTKSLGDMYNDDMLRSGTAPEAENFSFTFLSQAGIIPLDGWHSAERKLYLVTTCFSNFSDSDFTLRHTTESG